MELRTHSQFVEYFGAEKTVTLDGRTYKLERLGIGQFKKIETWMRDYRRAPYEGGPPSPMQPRRQINESLAAKVLAELDDRRVDWRAACDILSGQLFIVFLAMEASLKKNPQPGIVSFSEAIVSDRLDITPDELHALAFWLCSLEQLILTAAGGGNDEDADPLSEKIKSSGQP